MVRTVQIVGTDDQVTFEAPPLRLVFRWDGQRWTHELGFNDRTVASTVEWEPEADDPTRVVSPAYQQLSTQERSEGAQALLVGQWGHHHFSGVFTVNHQGSEFVIEADIAVLSRSPLQAFASTYLVALTSSDLVDANPQAIVWGCHTPSGSQLRFEAVEAVSHVGLAEAGRRATRVQANCTMISGKQTQRLQYRWCWLSNQSSLPAGETP